MLFKTLTFMISFFTYTFWSLNARSPYLFKIRELEPFLYISVGLILLLIGWKLFNKRVFIFIFLATIISASAFINNDINYRQLKQSILNQPTFSQLSLNKRFIIGFDDLEEVSQLSRQGIAGIYITTKNIKGKSYDAVQSFITSLQQERQLLGLPPLLIATDQEGGDVARMESLIGSEPKLANFLGQDKSREAAFNFGKAQGEKLQGLGINLNFSPVIDLKPSSRMHLVDLHTQIADRAISSNPLAVSSLAKAYINGLHSSGVTATMKHFPGLATADGDTHHFPAKVNRSVQQLQLQDWLPFIELSQSTDAYMMLSHVLLTEIDAINPVSTSETVISDIIRGQLGFKGKLITDDMTMGAVYSQGFCHSINKAYDAGVDYLLISYDHEKYYDAIDCLNNKA